MIFVVYMILINLMTFFLYGIDKRKAIKDKSRISEFSLITFVVLGGAFGGFLGMKVFHHKTKKKKFKITVPVFVVIYILFIMFALYQNYHLVITKYEYKSSKVSNQLDGYKIVQISDLHNQIFGIGQKTLLKKISSESPDVIFVTGDVVDINHTFYKPSEDFFKGAVKIAPVYYVTGNHEKWMLRRNGKKAERLQKFFSDIESYGVSYIDDEEVDMGDYTLTGVADSSLGNDITTSGSGLNVMLAHEPDYIANYRKAGADLVFCGHVHGGQMIFPGKGGIFAPGFSMFPKYYTGIYEQENTTMVVSRGLGNSLLPFRINNYPEIVVMELKSE